VIRHAWLALVLAIAAACGGPQHPEAPTIEDLRRRAAERPTDPMAASALAEGELLLAGGDASRARAAIDRAIELSPETLRLRLLSAVEHELHGELDAALDGWLDVLARAARSDDPLAPAIASIAAAEVESLDDSVEGYPARVREALGPLHAEPGRLGDEARATLGELLVDLAYRRADLDRVAEIVEAQRCVTGWRVIGPFGPRHLLSYDQTLPPDGDEALAASYELGPSRGERATRDVPARGCNVHVGGGPVGGPGTTFAEATFEVPTGGPWTLRLETPNPVHLFVDGEEIAAIDRRREPIGRVTRHGLTLSAGTHRVRARITSRHPNPVLAVTLTPGEPPAEPEPDETLTGAYVAAQAAMVRGDVVGARERLREHMERDGASAFLVAGAAATLNDPLRDSTVRHDEARRLLGWAADRDEAAWYPRLTLAQLEANEGRSEVAIDQLREASERWPGVVIFPLQLVDYLEQRGWHAQAEDAVEDARERVPSACRPRRAALNHARRRHRAGEVLEHARALVECDARTDAMLQLHVRRRQWDEALAEVARLATLEPEDSSIGELNAQLEVAGARGDDAMVAQRLETLRERLPLSAGIVLRQADYDLASGDAQAARTRLRAAIDEESEAMLELRRSLRAIGGEYPIESYRRDGREIIDALEQSDRTYEEPLVLVFDYTVYRVFEDGSMLELTHNIYRLQSQEAVDAMGEFHVPDGAHMLTLQTVKADGTRLEPDEIAGKETISFPNLSTGDYIEFEYVRGRGAPAGYPDGFVGDRFYFRNYETPFDLSQLTVVVPDDVELAIDPRGPAPETETTVEDGTRMYRWTVRESRPLVQEPGSVAAREFFPSIYWGHDATWDLYVESLRDVLADRDMIDPAAQRLVRTIVGETSGSTVEQQAERIYRWVLENVENSDDVFGLAPAMLAARNGNRTRVLRYLLDLAGLETDLVLARSFTSDATRAELADDDTYQHLVIRMRGSDGWVWLHAGARHAPFGYVPPTIAGMDALVLNEPAERVTLGDRALEEDLRTVEVDVELRRDGGARVSVVETYRGAGAVGWREQLEEVPEGNLEQAFEAQYVANLLPGAQLERLVISGREDPAVPLVMRYDVELASLARESADGWVLPPLFQAQLAPQYAPLASRTTTQIVPVGLALDIELRVEPPAGATFASAPPEVSLTALDGASVTIGASRDEGALMVRRSYRIPRMRIPAERYDELASFARAADEAEGAEVRVRL